jgi:molecular chaperone DnaK (HSP70)
MPESPPSSSAITDPIVGIDLGTTNSLVAIGDGSGARVLPDASGAALVPSVVRYVDPAGEGRLRVVVGREARDAAPEHPGVTISSVKRLMGRSRADAEADLKFLPYEVIEGEHRTARVRLPGGRIVSPQEVSAAILGELKTQAEAALGTQVRRAVVTVPAYFDDAQRQATRDAGRLAGLEVVRIVNEPTAAALAYGVGLGASARRGESAVAVYDLGGGTFDVSVLRLTPPASEGETSFFEVVSTAGDTRLGGDDFDHVIVERVCEASGVETTGLSESARSTLVATAERVKRELSDRESVVFEATIPGGAAVRREISRDEYEAWIGPLVDRTFDACARAMTDASGKLPAEGLSAVVLVGGATRTPVVRRRVKEFFGLEPYTALDPDQVVALGAAVQASILSGSTRGALLLDVVPLSLGLETAGGAVAKIIVRNSTVPARAKEMFSTQKDGQTAVRLSVYQGEREMAEHCRRLGEFVLKGLPPMPAGIPQLEVTFLVDANGVLNVSAVERRSGRSASLQVVPNHGLTREEVEKIEAESFAHAREDMTRHRVVDLVANCKLDLKWTMDRLAKFGNKLDAGGRAELETRAAAVRGLIEAAEADWRTVDPDAFHAAKEQLDRAGLRLQEISIAESLRGGETRRRRDEET